MSVFKTNHEEASSGFGPIPVGEYEAVVTKAEVTKAQSSGADMIKCELTLRDLPEQAQYKGRKFFNNLVFSVNAAPIVQSFLKAVGVPDGTDFATYQDIANAVAMKPVRFKNTHRMYNGEQQNNVSYVIPTKFPIGQGEQLPQPTASGPVASTPPAQVASSDLPF